jgi:hypothetical protein
VYIIIQYMRVHLGFSLDAPSRATTRVASPLLALTALAAASGPYYSGGATTRPGTAATQAAGTHRDSECDSESGLSGMPGSGPLAYTIVLAAPACHAAQWGDSESAPAGAQGQSVPSLTNSDHRACRYVACCVLILHMALSALHAGIVVWPHGLECSPSGPGRIFCPPPGPVSRNGRIGTRVLTNF